MANISTHQAGKFVKLMYIGDSGTGKTGSLVSLVEAGYNLRILDMDNGLDSLRQFIKHQCPDRESQVDFITLRDKFKADARLGAKIAGSPQAYTDATKYLTKWDDDTAPAEWGGNTILVLDSLTFLGRAALYWARGMNPSAKDGRQAYFVAQESIMAVMEMLTGENFHANVIVISHVDLQELTAGGLKKGFPSAVGSALGPRLPPLFNTLLLAESRGTGDNVKRTITTVPTQLIDLKNPAPFSLARSLPLETGLATVFKTLKAST